MEKLKIGISIGDMNGIGLEVILKTMANPSIFNLCIPVLYGSSKVVAYHKNIVNIDFPYAAVNSAENAEVNKVNVVNCWQEAINITLGKGSAESGKYAAKALEGAVQELKLGYIDALVTAPINKKAMQESGFAFPGHTEYITQELGAKDSLMLLVNDTFRVGLVTGHLPISKVAQAVTFEKVLSKIRIMHETLKIDFAIEKPVIAVLGLNPHAGDEGALGEEEQIIIRPAIEKAKAEGIMALGPFPADGFFGNHSQQKYDGILAMYHDQGLVAFKALAFEKGVNYTAGLAGIRTSPDHGTAYDIAGQNIANPTSFREALFAAIDIARNRQEHLELKSNPLRLGKKEREVIKAQADDYVE